jgi:hypothetical protein
VEVWLEDYRFQGGIVYLFRNDSDDDDVFEKM